MDDAVIILTEEHGSLIRIKFMQVGKNLLLTYAIYASAIYICIVQLNIIGTHMKDNDIRIHNFRLAQITVLYFM